MLKDRDTEVVEIRLSDVMRHAVRLCRESVTVPARGRTYSVNEAYLRLFPDGIQEYLGWVKTDQAGGYGLRYIGSLVADFHRTLLKGGVFLYPPTGKQPNGKLRLMYEANPIAFLAEQAGGTALDGCDRIMEKQPSSLHERTPLVIGGKDEVERVRNFIAQSSYRVGTTGRKPG